MRIFLPGDNRLAEILGQILVRHDGSFLEVVESLFGLEESQVRVGRHPVCSIVRSSIVKVSLGQMAGRSTLYMYYQYTVSLHQDIPTPFPAWL